MDPADTLPEVDAPADAAAAADPAEHGAAAPPAVDGAAVLFTVADPDRRLAGVRLWQEVRIPGDRLDFAREGGAWHLRLDLPEVDRFEYLLELTHLDGHQKVVPDAANPRRVPGAFGDKSVVEMPGYSPPSWVGRDAPHGTVTPLRIPARSLRGDVGGLLWSSAGTDSDSELPLLVVHDGPEYDELASLTSYLSVLVADGTIPPLRAALLAPGPRDDWYSANGAYTRALGLAVLPHLRATLPTTRVIGMGASLGALAMLVAHRRHPASFDALFLQSGSFFHRRYDEHERRFSQYDRVVRAVEEVLRASGYRDPLPTVLTCGAIEQNVANNRIMARTLAAQGYDVALHEVRDVHNYIAWRDAFDPHLTGLLRGEPPCGTPS